ncbi:OLC1v1029147C1 [Oldenlandia corymbosa var. corymbosa]|uniref:Glutamyl-tRNA(Gln) amidotransferase subunit C, chloroplastic/mitochondrial n=1 Tax=Oldenlandia corymbosa var. corymbosa TaxID=529605 RepID=A0AAV1CEQ7_OLDCO|nr:OLC1v1029147C1 [Oldenlandia corymbosa var. corymbosa]
MANRALLLLTHRAPLASHTSSCFLFGFIGTPLPAVKRSFVQYKNPKTRNYSTTKSSLEPPNLPKLAETARISLTPDEVEEFAPKIRQVVDWFGQLQAVDLESFEPAIRADTEGDNLRNDLPEIFENREGIITAIPSYEDPYIKVPKVLNKD